MNLKQIIDSFDKEISEVKNAPMLYGESKAKFGYRYKEGHTIYTCYNIDKIRQFISTSITQLLEELRIKQKDYKYDEENEDSCFQTFETLGEAYIEGENYCARKINSKIDKILNK